MDEAVNVRGKPLIIVGCRGKGFALAFFFLANEVLWLIKFFFAPDH